MIEQAKNPEPGDWEKVLAYAKRVRSVKCPVCEVQLTEFDLRSDPVLVRRVKRAEMAELRRREREMLDDGEDDQDGGDGGGGGGKRKRSGRRSLEQRKM